MKNINIISCLLFVLLSIQGKSQDASGIQQKFDEYRKNNLFEKIYAHTDREFYLCGEIIWFKIYCLNAVDHRPLDLSKVAYVEVLDMENNAVLQAKIALKEGLGSGSLFLPTSLEAGKYQFRAYTNWMKNYSADFYFHKEITVVNTFKNLKPSQEMKQEKPEIVFFPEGGNLVQGLTSKVAVKGINAGGKSFEYHGKVYNSDGDTVVRFSSSKFGMGNFYFTPDKDQSYKAELEDRDGNRHTYELPQVYNQGFVMAIKGDEDSLSIEIQGGDMALQNLYIFAHSRMRIVNSGTISYEGKKLNYKIAKAELLDGINQITLFDRNKKPICERLYFKRPQNKLVVKSDMNKKRFNSREKISAELSTMDLNGVTEKASLSVAVYQLDSLNKYPASDIHSYLLLTSDLVGNVESPEFYFRNGDPQMEEYTDNLMLTHGWRRFVWEEFLNKDTASKDFIPEFRGHIANAKLNNKQTGQAVADMYCFISTPGKFVNTTPAKSDGNGVLSFEMTKFYGPGEIFLQTNGKADSLYTFEIISPFSTVFGNTSLHDVQLIPDVKEHLRKRSLDMQTQNVYLSEELNRFENKINVQSFFYKADKTYRLDDYTRFTTMEDVMREYIPEIWVRKKGKNFNFRALDASRNLMFEENPMIFYDGIPVFDVDKIMEIDPLKIEKMDIMTSRYFLGPLTFNGLISYTTYNGDLDGFQIDPSANVISYDGLQLQREFYQPKYDTPENKTSRVPDFRNLLYWSPQVLTGEDGKETLEFYSSDLTGDFVMVVEGITSKGLAGSGTFTFKVGREVN